MSATTPPPGRRIALTEHPYDRLADRRRDDAWLLGAWERPGTRVLVLSGTRLRASAEQGVHWSTPVEAPDGVRVLLGEDDERVSFAVLADRSVADADRVPDQPMTERAWVDLRTVAPALGADDAAYAVHAAGLAEWRHVMRYCPRCGGGLRAVQAGHVLECTSCGKHQFPRTDPAVIMLVRDLEGRALLGRQRVWPAGRFSTLAGFVEPGESLEMAVRREVLEEVGVRVGEVDYVGSQPWPMPASLMLGFVAHAESSDITVDGHEIEDARWFTREEIRTGAEDGSVVLPGSISISRALIEDWYDGPLPGSW